jgi:hypothetical protein
LPKPRGLGSVSIPTKVMKVVCPPASAREAKMNWIMLLWPSIASVLILLSACAWRDTLKTENAVRAHIDDIPFRTKSLRHRDDEHHR